MGYSRQEYWSGLIFPCPGYLPDPGMEPASSALAGRFFTTELPGSPINTLSQKKKKECADLLFLYQQKDST